MMRRAVVALLSLFFVISSGSIDVCDAQMDASSPSSGSMAAASPPPDIENALVEGATEWSLGGAAGIDFPGDNSRFAFQSLSWARVLTSPAGPDFVRGRFEWGVEVIPLFGQFYPGRAVGIGISPLLWRWNLERRGPIAGFGEVGGGGLWTSAPIPEGTVDANFTAHVSVGMRMLTNPHRGVVVAYRFEHISNGNRADRNPGVNAHVIYFGLTTFRAPRH
jgi:lipid A 3-O-deacylase PagL